MKKTNLILAALILGAGSCFADVVTINLDAPSVNALPGDILSVTGVLLNNDLSTVDLNDISVTLDGMFVTDITPFFSGPPTIDPGSQTVDFGLLLVTVLTPYTDPVGPHTGTITIFGGVEGPGGYDPTTQNMLGSANFTINVVEAPEPGSAALCAAIAALFLPFQCFRKTVRLKSQLRN